ncbi:MAG TPA: 4Fe-4S dicluster domain-containing protein [Thermoplasmata archaeon]|nr:4Fe-4S dicluster domain-containing protein [Thermoplasmata archaeon]
MSIVARLPRPPSDRVEEESPEPPALLIRGRHAPSPEERSLSEEILTEFRADPRSSEFVLGCLNCGECTSGCPAARFYDFSPREMVQVAIHADAPTLWDAMQEKIWACCQCYSCTMRCRFGNDIGGIISVMRELSVRHGLDSARKTLAPFGRTFRLLTTVGTQISPDMIQPEFFRDWGPAATRLDETWGVPLEVLRKAIPIDVLRTTRAAWEVSVQTSLELFRIYEETGVLDMLRGVDPDLVEMLVDLVDERRGEFEEAKRRFQLPKAEPAGPSSSSPG